MNVMALIKPTSTETDIKARIAALMARRDDAELPKHFRNQTIGNVERCERNSGIPSERVHQVIDDGTLEETREVVEWIFDDNRLCRAGER